jgi:hypothetical protein
VALYREKIDSDEDKAVDKEKFPPMKTYTIRIGYNDTYAALEGYHHLRAMYPCCRVYNVQPRERCLALGNSLMKEIKELVCKENNKY